MYVGIVERVDVDGETAGVHRQFFLVARLQTVVVARRVVGGHAALIVAAVLVYRLHALYAVLRIVQLAEDVDKVGCDGFVADELAYLHLPVLVVM